VEREGHPAEGRLDKSDADWERELTPEQFRITRRSGTELACSGPYLDTKEEGVFHCVCCGQALFDSSRKYDSGTGWPSYWEPVDAEHVTIRADDGIFGRRFEVLCSRCNAHLGHVFEDGPQPTGLRYCMNGQALRFVPRQTTAKKEDK
jgi:peptide-methionine (R)-S-oxide reductase